MQRPLVCLQDTVGDHTGGINKDCKQFKRESLLLSLSRPVHYRIEIFFFILQQIRNVPSKNEKKYKKPTQVHNSTELCVLDEI